MPNIDTDSSFRMLGHRISPAYETANADITYLSKMYVSPNRCQIQLANPLHYP